MSSHQLRLFPERIHLKMSFADLFHDAVTGPERRARWEEWKRLALENSEDGRFCVEMWTDISDCHDCIERDGDWCSWGYPCTVNPVLSFRMGMVGKACCGMGYRKAEGTTE